MTRSFHSGDRIRVSTVGDDGFPIVRYGTDLLHDPTLRAGLADLWRAEVDLAGLVVATLFPMKKDGIVGIADGQQFLLAEFTYNGEPWVVRGIIEADSPATVVVRADRMNRWDGFIH